MGVRPEPVVGFFARRRPRRRRRGDSNGAGSRCSVSRSASRSAGLMAAPTGFVALAPLVAAAPVDVALVRQGSAAGGRWPAGGWWCSPRARSGACSASPTAPTATSSAPRRSSRRSSGPDLVPGVLPLRGAPGTTESHFGSYARRAAVLVCLLALVWFLVLLVAARARDLVVPFAPPARRVDALLAFALLLPTPSKPRPTTSAPSPGWARCSSPCCCRRSPLLVAALDRERRVPQARWSAAALSAVLVFALAGHGRDMWPYGWGLGHAGLRRLPLGARASSSTSRSGGRSRSRRSRVAVAAAAAAGRRAWRRLALGVAAPVLVVVLLLTFTVWTVGDFARAAVRPRRRGHPRSTPGTTRRAPAAGWPTRSTSSTPVGARRPPGRSHPRPCHVARTRRPTHEPFVPGASTSPPARPVRGRRPTAPVCGSFLVPAPGANADARLGTFATDWYRLPPARRTPASPSPCPAVRRGVSLRAEYGRADRRRVRPAGRPADRRRRTVVEWRTVPLVDEAAPPPGADVVRLVAVDDSTTTGGWLAFTAPDRAALGPLPRVPARPTAPSGSPGRSSRSSPAYASPASSRASPSPRPPPSPTATRPGARWRTGPSSPSGAACWATPSARPTSPCSPPASAAPATRSTTSASSSYRQPYPSDGYELIRRRQTVSGLP